MRGSPVIQTSLESRVDAAAFMGAHQRYLQGVGAVPGGQAFGRRTLDGAGAVLDFAKYREETNARRIDRAIAETQGRSDGYSVSAGVHLARDLEHVYQEVLREKMPLPSAFDVFQLDETVPAGATSYNIRRIYDIGEARVWRGPGTEVPRSEIQQREESQPVRYLVSGYGWDLFTALSDAFANRKGFINRQAELLRVSRNALMRLANRIWWQGSEADGLYGIFNYPWLPKKVIPEGFSAATVAANPDDTLAALNALVNFPHQTSKGELYPDTLLLTNHVHDVLGQTRFGSGSDKTILAHFKETTPHIKQIKVCWELEDAGGANMHGVLACRTDEMGIRPVLTEGVQQLPVQEKGFESLVLNYMGIGGVRINDPLANILGFVDITA